MFLEILAGALLKVYDDFIDDDPIIKDEYVISIIRTLQIAFTAVVLANDFWLCLAFCLFNMACMLSKIDEYTGPHSVSYAAMVPFLLVFSWPNRGTFGPTDYAILSILVGNGLSEPFLFPEETSIFKGVTRAWWAAMCVPGIVCFPKLSPSLVSLISMFFGYSLVSSMVQMLKLTGLVPTHRPNPSAYEPLHAYIPTLA